MARMKKEVTGAHLRQMREKSGLSIGELAQLLGYSWSQMQRMEKGKRHVSKRVISWLLSKGWIK